MISPVELLKIKVEKQRQQDMKNFLASQATAKSVALNRLRQEYAQAQREQHKDTDFDGISDPEEYTIGTNPHSADSDWDGLGDLEEISSWSNPRTYNEQYSDCPDAERQREI